MSCHPMIRNMKANHRYPLSFENDATNPKRVKFSSYLGNTHNLAKATYKKAIAILSGGLGQAVLNDNQQIYVQHSAISNRLRLREFSSYYEQPTSDDILAVNELILDRKKNGFDLNDAIRNQYNNSFFHLISSLIRYSEEKFIFKLLMSFPKYSSQLISWAMDGNLHELLSAEEAFGTFLSPEDSESFFNMMLDLYIKYHPHEKYSNLINLSPVHSDIKAKMLIRLAKKFPDLTNKIISKSNSKMTKELSQFIINSEIKEIEKIHLISNSLNNHGWNINDIRGTISGIGEHKKFIKLLAIHLLTSQRFNTNRNIFPFIEMCKIPQEELVDLIHASILAQGEPPIPELLNLLTNSGKKILYKEILNSFSSNDEMYKLLTLVQLDQGQFINDLPLIQEQFATAQLKSMENYFLRINNKLKEFNPDSVMYKDLLKVIKFYGNEIKAFNKSKTFLLLLLNRNSNLPKDSLNRIAEYYDTKYPDLLKSMFSDLRKKSSHIVTSIEESFGNTLYIYRRAIDLIRLNPSERRLIEWRIQFLEGNSILELIVAYTDEFKDKSKLLEVQSELDLLPDGKWKLDIVNKILPGNLEVEEDLVNHYRSLAVKTENYPSLNFKYILTHLLNNNEEHFNILSSQLFLVTSENERNIERVVFKLNKICSGDQNLLSIIIREIEDPEVKYQAAKQFLLLHHAFPVFARLSQEQMTRFRAEFSPKMDTSK